MPSQSLSKNVKTPSNARKCTRKNLANQPTHALRSRVILVPRSAKLIILLAPHLFPHARTERCPRRTLQPAAATSHARRSARQRRRANVPRKKGCKLQGKKCVIDKGVDTPSG